MLSLGMQTKNRIFYCDATKVLAIFLVCVYHYNNLNFNILDYSNLGTYINYYFSGIPSMAVPLFFMVNGALLLNKPYRLKKHLKKVLYLYILVYAWSLISLIVFIPIEGSSYSLSEFFKAWFLHIKDVNNHLWFLETLISVYLLFPFIKLIYDLPQRELLKLFCIIIFVFSFGNVFLNNLLNLVEFILGVNYVKYEVLDFFSVINPFGNYYYAFFYFISGGILYERIKNDSVNISTRVLLISFFTSLFILFLYGVLMTFSDKTVYDTVWYGNSSIMTLIMSISTFLLLSRLAYKNRNINHHLTVIGSNTLGIYLVHRFLGAITISYFRGLALSNNLILNIFYGVFLVLTSLFVVLLIEKLPFLNKAVKL